MTPSARINTSMELLGEIIASWQQPRSRAADNIIAWYFKERRFIGSKDRGAISELVYFILRHYASLSWWIERFHLSSSARLLVITALALREKYASADFEQLFNGEQYAPKKVTETEQEYIAHLRGQEILHPDMPPAVKGNYPAWLQPELEALFGTNLETEMLALNQEAPVDLRANTLKTTRDQVIASLAQEGFECASTPFSPLGIRLKKRIAAFNTEAFKKGWFEMQDEGSQLVAFLADVEPGMKVIDFCAGAGGKSLAMAAAMKNKGRILAWDTSRTRLNQMPIRLRRAGVDNVQLHQITSEHDAFIKRHKASADRVLVDAPCSGSGTWRRNPDAKWRLTPQSVEETIAITHRILNSAIRLVKPGGRLIYATCSLLQSENERQVEQLLQENNNFRVVSWKKVWNKVSPPEGRNDFSHPNGDFFRVTPHQDGMDGFFTAILEKNN